MKTVQQKLKWKGMIAGAALLALAFSSCSKHNDNLVTAPLASLEVIDVSPTSPNLDFYVDGSKVNSSSLVYGGGLIYFNLYAGVRHIGFYQNGTSTAFKLDTVNLQSNSAYTMVLSNLPSNPDVTLLRDSVAVPASGNAAIRLINASPDAGAVDFGIRGKAIIGAGVAYRKATQFTQLTVNAALNDTLKIYKSGTQTVLQSVPVNLQAGGIYTVYLYGFAGQTAANEKLNGAIIANAYFSN